MYQKLIYLFILSLFLLTAGSKVHSQTEVLWSKYFYEANGGKFSADGNVVMIAKSDTIYFFDTYTGEPTSFIKKHSRNGYIKSFGLSDDGETVFTCNWNSCNFWDYNTWELKKTIDWTWQIWDAQMSSDGKYFVTAHIGTDQNSIKLWDVETGETIQSGYISGQGELVAISNDNRYCAVLEDKKPGIQNIWLYDLITLDKLNIFNVTSGYIEANDIAFSPDGKYLAATDENGYIKVWDTETREKIVDILHTDKPDENLFTEQLCFTSDSKYLITCGGYFYDKTTKVWDLPKMDLIHTFEHPYCSFYIFDISSNDSLLAMYFQDYIHIIHNNFLTSSLNINTVTDTLQYPNPVKDIITIELEQELSPKIKIELFDNSGKLVKNFSLDEIMINNTSITLYMAFLSSGSYFLNISTDGFSKTYSFIKI